ncbi:unnamed protein product [Didymodactylos carnosus]|uniref:Rab-GAP TBC domain-containing protein n=1 Tax=Didymodactylos carnosus TaxID=1234261 RepID=A0A813WHW2_9BILA|nr:unnamed protein product [Didymodactylos carnosus]CAF0855589.1 unnamed protein product [Didymodactylos carnosus]CAF3523765.1 unnamed protein product [Didymodactylos carnosus]CAF3643336.1 unnamed protein product [Didymodactylos carnosus]
MVELKGPGYTSHYYNNIFIIIPAIIVVILVGFVAYRLVNSLLSKKRRKEEKARLKQAKKSEKQQQQQPKQQASPQANEFQTYRNALQTAKNVKQRSEQSQISYLNKGQSAWEKRIVKSLNTMCSELNMSLAKQRNETEMRAVKRHWNELGHICTDLNRFRPVYSAKDFLDVITGLQNPNLKIDETLWNVGLIKVPLVTKTLLEIKFQYKDITTYTPQYCSDESILIEDENVRYATQIIEKKKSSDAHTYSKRGCPTSLRGKLWCMMLDVNLDNWHLAYFNYLKQNVIEYDLLVDYLYFKDVKLTAVNDDQLFVFEDFLYQVLLLFSRDTSVQACFEHSGCQAPKSFIKKKLGADECAVVYPPNGIIPFHGFSMLGIAPMCFVYEDPILLYFVFHKLYMTHFFKLHHVSADPKGIVGLCVLFECLMRQVSPELYFHLQNSQIQPLRIAFKWIMRAFSGYLACSQLLALWDRILAYESLEIVAVLAVAIFILRKHNVLAVTSESAVEAIFSDISSIKVIPLLQFFLS